jgi:hypothetical protein
MLAGCRSSSIFQFVSVQEFPRLITDLRKNREKEQEGSTPTYGDWVVDVFGFDNVAQKHR